MVKFDFDLSSWELF